VVNARNTYECIFDDRIRAIITIVDSSLIVSDCGNCQTTGSVIDPAEFRVYC